MSMYKHKSGCQKRKLSAERREESLRGKQEITKFLKISASAGAVAGAGPSSPTQTQSPEISASGSASAEPSSSSQSHPSESIDCQLSSEPGTSNFGDPCSSESEPRRFASETLHDEQQVPFNALLDPALWPSDVTDNLRQSVIQVTISNFQDFS